MKAQDLIDSFLGNPDFRVVAELPNGQQVPIARYRHDDDARGDPIFVLEI